MPRPCPLVRSLAVLFLAAAQAGAQEPSQSWSGLHPGDAWGHTVAVVGDVDADGHDDWAVGSPVADVLTTTPVPLLWPDVGRVTVYSGASASVLHSWRGTLDGGSEFGFAIAGAGDVDGDGHADVLVGAPRADGPAVRGGLVRLYSGRTGAVLRTLYGLQTDARFGHAVDGGVDATGDGVPDALVGSPWEDLDGPLGAAGQEGNARLVSLANGAIHWTADWDSLSSSSDAFGCGSALICVETLRLQAVGSALALLGDQDGDGAVELLVGAPLSDVLIDRKDTISSPWENVITWTDGGAYRVVEPFGDLDEERRTQSSGLQVGAALADLGPAPSDLGRLLAVGVPGQPLLQSRVETLLLDEDGAEVLTDLATIEGSPDQPLGASLAGIGDRDGDGWPDLAVGSPLTDVGSPFQILQAGQVRLHRASDGALLETLDGDSGFGFLGRAVAGGDLDGDGLADVVAGAPGADVGSVDLGLALLFPGHGCPAAVTAYGSGWPGTLGVPALDPLGLPVLGGPFALDCANSSGTPSVAYLLLGLDDAALTVKGGTVLVEALLTVVLPLPAAGLAISLPPPADPALCGLPVFVQALQADPGASHGASFSRGLRLDLGY